MAVDMKSITQLREQTGLGLMDCKKALEEAQGNIEKAIEILRKKGALSAAKRLGKETSQGLVYAYIHPGSKVGVLVELNCETDFVASNENMKKFAHDLCMHIAASRPVCVNSDQLNPDLVARERQLFTEQLAGSGKPENIVAQIVEGKMKNFYAGLCLLNQPFVKDDKKTIDDLLKELIAKTGENIRIKNFARFEVAS